MSEAPIWVGLSEAAKILGVHPATVRSWADRGLLPSQRTPGGHRRFRRADVLGWLEGQSVPPSTEITLLIQSAMGRARIEIGEGHLTDAEWYHNLGDQARQAMALQGRRIMEGLQHYLASATDAVLAQARQLGLEYGQMIRSQKIRLSEAVEVFFVFNDIVLETTLQISDLGRFGDRSDAVRKVYAFTREIILAVIEAYEQAP